MFKIIKDLKEDEEIIKIIRRHFSTVLFHFLLALILIALSLFLLFYLTDAGLWQIIGFIIPFAIGLFYGLRKFILWHFTCFVITSQRIINCEQKGFLHRRVSEIFYDKIQDVSYQIKGVLPTLFRYGTVRIQTAGSDEGIELKKISRPQNVQEMIDFAHAQFDKLNEESAEEDGESNGFLTAEEALARLSTQELSRLMEMADNVMNKKEANNR